MRVGVLGGGLQGCCIALALAERGIAVTLIDKNEQLLSRTAVANEGKIHLGYMYAGDPTLATAWTMLSGAFEFAPFFARHLGILNWDNLSSPAVYVVHRTSQRGLAEIANYLSAVDELVGNAPNGAGRSYFGMNPKGVLRRWSTAEVETEFDAAQVSAAFDTPEVAINSVQLAELMRDCIGGNKTIELRLSEVILSAEAVGDQVRVTSRGGHGVTDYHFDHVFNALWDGRLALNETFGLGTNRPWLHRLKYGVSFRRPYASFLRSVTVILGPFGEVVSYPDGLTYLTWYPECLHGISAELVPPPWVTYPQEPLRSRIFAGTLKALARLVPSLDKLDPDDLTEVAVKGGAIVAWGKTDIYDAESELHRRYEIGVTSLGRFHSVDPGKLTMAPYFANRCAQLIASES